MLCLSNYKANSCYIHVQACNSVSSVYLINQYQKLLMNHSHELFITICLMNLFYDEISWICVMNKCHMVLMSQLNKFITLDFNESISWISFRSVRWILGISLVNLNNLSHESVCFCFSFMNHPHKAILNQLNEILMF